MERAAAGAARAILAHNPAPSATVLCGPGNNGGDGWGRASGAVDRSAASPADHRRAVWDRPCPSTAESGSGRARPAARPSVDRGGHRYRVGCPCRYR
ncbi:MAG: NAD(P)H-hydrate epimerase [Sandarakinorhabdus sp.]|nr:NAD(P)H-hydrate epimerase [Sandarakinorhabdus sp.]